MTIWHDKRLNISGLREILRVKSADFAVSPKRSTRPQDRAHKTQFYITEIMQVLQPPPHAVLLFQGIAQNTLNKTVTFVATDENFNGVSGV